MNKNSIVIIFTLRKQLFHYDSPTFFLSLSFSIIIIINFKQHIIHNNNIYDLYELLYHLIIQNKIFVNITTSAYLRLFQFFG